MSGTTRYWTGFEYTIGDLEPIGLGLGGQDFFEWESTGARGSHQMEARALGLTEAWLPAQNWGRIGLGTYSTHSAQGAYVVLPSTGDPRPRAGTKMAPALRDMTGATVDVWYRTTGSTGAFRLILSLDWLPVGASLAGWSTWLAESTFTLPGADPIELSWYSWQTTELPLPSLAGRATTYSTSVVAPPPRVRDLDLVARLRRLTTDAADTSTSALHLAAVRVRWTS